MKMAKEQIDEQAGAINRRINEIACDNYGYPGIPESWGKIWFEVFRNILKEKNV